MRQVVCAVMQNIVSTTVPTDMSVAVFDVAVVVVATPPLALVLVWLLAQADAALVSGIGADVADL